jgi:polyphosphate glucokinase
VTATPRRILVIDIGGSHVKLLATGQRRSIKVVSGPTMTPADMVAGVRAATAHWEYDVVSIGYPGPVVADAPAADPPHLGPGWVGFGYAAAFERPIKMRNDAAMQALGGYRGGRMLFLGLGTGLGSALVIEGHLQPLELAHLPYRKKKTFEDYVGEASRARRGQRRWQRYVIDVVTRLKAAIQADHVLLGGGNARHMRDQLIRLPKGTHVGGNADAFRGGMRLWLSADERVTAGRTRRPPVGSPSGS